MKQFNEKVIVVTGAASGIGRELAVQLSKKGSLLALTDIDQAGLDALFQELGGDSLRVFTYQLNITQPDDVADFAQAVIQHFGRVEGVLHAAGVAMGDIRFEAMQLDDFKQVMNINLMGTVHIGHAFLPLIKAQAGESFLVNISSVFGLVGTKFSSAYNASKFAVDGLTQAIAAENLNDRLLVSTVFPAGVKTNITANAVLSERRSKSFEKQLTLSPAIAAETILRGIQKKKTRIMVGKNAYIVDWMRRLMPSTWLFLLNRFFVKKSGE